MPDEGEFLISGKNAMNRAVDGDVATRLLKVFFHPFNHPSSQPDSQASCILGSEVLVPTPKAPANLEIQTSSLSYNG